MLICKYVTHTIAMFYSIYIYFLFCCRYILMESVVVLTGVMQPLMMLGWGLENVVCLYLANSLYWKL